jgi:hypothetical protein
MSVLFPLVNSGADYEYFKSKLGWWDSVYGPDAYKLELHHKGDEWRHWIIVFDNGWRLSVRQFGLGSYSSENTVELLASNNETGEMWEEERRYQTLDDLAAAFNEIWRYGRDYL